MILLRGGRTPLLVLAVTLALAGCGGGSPSSSPGSTPGATAPGPRPSSPAHVVILQPTNGQVITGTTVHIVLSLTGATITTVTTTNISPTLGHVHLYVDNNLVSMNYGLTQDITVSPGTYVLQAEFVASDHAPFDPRVRSAQVFFTVK